MYHPTVLSIAGSDSYGGAGVEIDSKTIHALGGYALRATTALTAQNSIGVKAILATPKEMFDTLLETLLSDIRVDAVKIGMLANCKIISSVIEAIDKYELKNIVLDTVLVSSSGKNLLEPKAIDLMVRELFPRVDLITPNLLEVATFVGEKESVEEMAEALFGLGANAVLIKGGHSLEKEAIDYLICRERGALDIKHLTKLGNDGFSLASFGTKVSDSNEFCKMSISSFSSPRIKTTHTHGTGCILSSAIATHLAQKESLVNSVKLSKEFLYKNMRESHSMKLKYNKVINSRREPILLTQC